MHKENGVCWVNDPDEMTRMLEKGAVEGPFESVSFERYVQIDSARYCEKIIDVAFDFAKGKYDIILSTVEESASGGFEKPTYAFYNWSHEFREYLESNKPGLEELRPSLEELALENGWGLRSCPS